MIKTDYTKEELKEILREYITNYKDTLNLPSNLTFGIEIEEAGINTMTLQKILNGKWKISPELSIKKVTGGEASSPIFIDSPKTWQEIFDVCNILKENKAYITEEIAGHIHFGNKNLIDNDPIKLLNIMKMWSAYENVIYRFSKGEFSTLRDVAYDYASPIARDVKKISLMPFIEKQNIRNMMGLFFTRRFRGLNIYNMYSYYKLTNGIKFNNEIKASEIKDTIEVRCPNGTLDPKLWQNNINFFSKLLLYAVSDEFDSEKIDYILNSLEFQELILLDKKIDLSYLSYMNIDMDLAIDLADTIFKDETEKFDFLKQYTKKGRTLVKH